MRNYSTVTVLKTKIAKLFLKQENLKYATSFSTKFSIYRCILTIFQKKIFRSMRLTLKIILEGTHLKIYRQMLVPSL